MLDNETKRRIDTARNILVGKLPDPKSQVEQITIALIYKFMDDMDAQSVEYGGEPSFFVGDYEKYGWRKIFSPSIGGFEMLNLYGEAITSLNQNANLPQLFRDVFKNAFLPYRDPETLKLFLKTINEFQYDHSERLGDAFEYLLSVLGSQGDAGQFRTPRHIIDFIVEVVQPQKNETVCDPACGTAGFLISSYKHILKANTRNTPGDMLTPDDRRRLMQNFVGYDISPDMVRLSLVNMYLHGFPDPHIYEYDTLTSEDRWNESFDVIMANPPFMSPKGGIKPHNKFSLQANRSEVLFVDYIAEHINPVSGRAGMIVPEGIIFQSTSAYRDLRKMLVEKNYLYAVISLPAGVFQPYSGVKTSILFFDKTLATRGDKILFVKIADDGFGLGAQRRELKTSDLPDALTVIRKFKGAITNGDTSCFAEGDLPLTAFAVEKRLIAATSDFNLSGERYRNNKHQNHKFENVEIGELYEINYGVAESIPQNLDENGIKIISTAETNIDGSLDLSKVRKITLKKGYEKFLLKPDTLLFNWRNAPNHVGKTVLFNEANDQYIYASFLLSLRKKVEIENKYTWAILNKLRADGYFKRMSRQAVNQTNFNATELAKTKIPLPPLEVQRALLERVESYQQVIEGAKQVIRSFKPTINFNPDWQMVELGEVLEKVNDSLNPKEFEGSVNYVGLENIESQTGNLIGEISKDIQEIKSIKSRFSANDILYGKLRPNLNKVWLSELEGICSTDIFVLRSREGKAIPRFYSIYLRSEEFNQEVLRGIKGAQLPRVGYEYFSMILVPLPPIEEQKQIAAQFEHEQSLVNPNKELIAIYEQKLKDEINKLWEQ